MRGCAYNISEHMPWDVFGLGIPKGGCSYTFPYDLVLIWWSSLCLDARFIPSLSLSLSLSSSFSLCLSVAGWWVFCRAQDTGDTKYADITQTTHRGQVVLHGVVKTLATSTRLYDLKTSPMSSLSVTLRSWATGRT